MPPKTIRKEIRNRLERLTAGEFKKFCNALITDEGIATNRVEGKDYLDVTNVVVTNFGEAKALKVVIDLLRDNGCEDHADALDKATKELTSEAGSSQSAGASAGTDRVTPKADGEHFVDRHEVQLIKRVNNVSQILDELRSEKVINRETYKTIGGLQPSEVQMRKIYEFLNTRACKDIFYKILVEKEKWLIDELKQNE